MPFSLVKAIKSTHRNPVNRILHFMGLPNYSIGITLMLGYFLSLNTDPHPGNNSMVNSNLLVSDRS
jgi:hypothetical protein